VKKHAAFKWKYAISRFPVSPGSAEALVRWGEKIKYIFIAYFLGNVCAKNCRNRTVYVKILASCKGGTFFETQCGVQSKPNERQAVYNAMRSNARPFAAIKIRGAIVYTSTFMSVHRSNCCWSEVDRYTCRVVMAALRSGCGHYIFALWFLLSSFFFLSSFLA